MENILQNITDLKEREQTLIDTCHSVMEGTIKKAYTSAELAMFKDQLMTQSIELNSKKDELKELSAPLKVEIKECTSVIRDLCQKLKYKVEEVEGKIYLMDDQDQQIMFMYNSTGEFQGTRKLMPHEKQTSIKSISKQA